MFLFRARMSLLSKVKGVSVLLSFISLLSNCQNQCVVHFQRAWGNCLVVGRWLSTSVCHSFQKSGSPVGFVVSACLQRPFGGLRLFRLNFFEGEPSSLFGCVWARKFNFAPGLAMGGDDIASSPPFQKTPRLWTPWGAPFGALCGHWVG